MSAIDFTHASWEDITPIPQDDGPNPLAQIAYREEYSEATSYLRALMAKEEYSERGLELTARIIQMNPAHYTVWTFRYKTLMDIRKETLDEEIDWLNAVALAHEKNYQIWHHRQLIMDSIGKCDGETDFIAKMLEKDSKNYHVWSYRQWLVNRFEIADDLEIKYLEALLQGDVRNNSAWNHRFFIVNRHSEKLPNAFLIRELEFAKTKLRLVPQNQSGWNYLRGTLSRNAIPFSVVEDFCLELAPLHAPDKITSSHALDLLAEIYAVSESESSTRSAILALDLLSTKFDPIRANYWNYRKRSIEQPQIS